MSAEQQQALDSLYALDNVLTVKITMPQADWDKVRTEPPKGGVCNFDWTGGARFTWRKATSVEISGTNFPARTTFTDVGVKKKSFCGSLNSEKPCLHIDFGRFSETNRPAIEALIGSRYLTLNNSIQDRSYIRQTLGYRLLAMAGLPHSRCNYARVSVNGTLIGEGLGGVNSPGIYVSAEPVMKRYIERNFNGNLSGNLYELMTSSVGGPSGASVPGHARSGLERGRILATIWIPGQTPFNVVRGAREKSLATELGFEGHMKWAEAMP